MSCEQHSERQSQLCLPHGRGSEKAGEPGFFRRLQMKSRLAHSCCPTTRLRFEYLFCSLWLSRACQMICPWLADAVGRICCFSHFLGTKTSHRASVASFGGKYCEVFLEREHWQDGDRKASTGISLSASTLALTEYLFLRESH